MKEKRAAGESYIGWSRAKSGEPAQPKNRQQREIGPRCVHNALESKSRQSIVCGQIEESDRMRIFKVIWAFKSWTEKKAYLRGLVATRCAHKRRKNDGPKKRENHEFHDCYLPNGTGEKYLVCKKLTLSTLSISKNQFALWCVEDSFHVEPEDDETDNREPELPTVPLIKKSRKDVRCNGVMTWLDKIQKVPSHYCRASSSKSYVDASFRSYANMHSIYS